MKRHCAAPGFPRCEQEKAPRKGLVGSGFVHEVVLALTREEDMLPRVASGVTTVEHDHFVVVDVGVCQVGAGDMAHVQRAVRALQYQKLADGVVLGLGVDARYELGRDVRCARKEVGGQAGASVKWTRPAPGGVEA